MGRSGLATNSYLATPADLMLTRNEGEPRYAETEVRPVTCFFPLPIKNRTSGPEWCGSVGWASHCDLKGP